MPRRPRHSFGGNTGTGIFWRKRFCAVDEEVEEKHVDDTLQSDGEDDVSAPPASSPAADEASDDDDEASNTQEEQGGVSIGWDDDLCRPIYIHPDSQSSADMVVTSEGDEEAEDAGDLSSLSSENKDGVAAIDDKDAETSTAVPFVLPEVLQNAKARGRKKRTKTFGDRNVVRRPLSLILSQQQDNEEQSLDDDLQESNKRQRTHIQMDSLAMLAPASAINAKSRRVSSSPMVQNSSDEEDDFAFPVEDDSANPKMKGGSASPLKRAREFFAELDKTQKLTVDSSFSPTVSGRITRTSRRIDYTSPRVNTEYRKYVEATESSGVTPLTIKDFVKSRKLQFETKGGDLFDGFLDEA